MGSTVNLQSSISVGLIYPRYLVLLAHNYLKPSLSPLPEQKGKLIFLINHFLSDFIEKNRSCQMGIPQPSTKAPQNLL